MKPQNTAIILMSAILPTVGHSTLIDFAMNLPHINKVELFLGFRDGEPISKEERKEVFQKHYKNSEKPLNIVLYDETYAPDADGSVAFWEWWRDVMYEVYPDLNWVNQRENIYFVSSESYGDKMAEYTFTQHIPYDVQRVINPTKGTNVRHDMANNWEQILIEMRQKLATVVTLFGQESVGKTTLMHELAKHELITGIPEWARLYLETTSSELTTAKMNDIENGQYSLQKMTRNKVTTPIIVQDTDLLTTLGIYNLYQEYKPQEFFMNLIEDSFAEFYYVLPDNIPFEEDQLRYGGNVRETNIQYWIDILESFNRKYIIVKGTTIEEKKNFILEHVLKRMQDKFDNICSHQRVS